MVAAHGRNFLLRPRSAPGERLAAVVRARRTDCVVGDQVTYRRLNRDQAVIERVLPRRNQVAERRSPGWSPRTIIRFSSAVMLDNTSAIWKVRSMPARNN